MERFARFLTSFALFLTIAFLLLPIVVVIPVSFTEAPIFAFPPEGFSLQWYGRIRNVDGLLSALGLSAQIAALSTAISLLLGTLCAIALVRGRLPGRGRHGRGGRCQQGGSGKYGDSDQAGGGHDVPGKASVQSSVNIWRELNGG